MSSRDYRWLHLYTVAAEEDEEDDGSDSGEDGDNGIQMELGFDSANEIIDFSDDCGG